MAYENLPDTQTSRIIIESYMAVERYARANTTVHALGDLILQARAAFEPDDYKNSGEDRWLGFWLTVRDSISNNGMHADPDHVLKTAAEYIANPVLPNNIPLETDQGL